MGAGRPLRKEGVVSQQMGDEWILYDPDDESVHIINSMAEFVLKMCDGSINIDDMEDRVRDAFSVPDEANLRKDLETILRNFRELGVVNFDEG